jgi:hypothetical protein
MGRSRATNRRRRRPRDESAAYNAIGFERFFQIWMLAVLAVGLWVTAIAFAA